MQIRVEAKHFVFHRGSEIVARVPRSWLGKKLSIAAAPTDVEEIQRHWEWLSERYGAGQTVTRNGAPALHRMIVAPSKRAHLEA